VAETWLAAAEQLADDARDLGFGAAASTASAWQARCLPDATRSLVQAAVSLAGTDALASLWDRLPACPSAGDFLLHAEELEGEAAALGKRASDMTADCRSVLDGALEEHAAARKRLAALQRMAPATEEAITAIQAEITDMQERLAVLGRVIGDCEAAIDLLGQVTERLEYALNCFRRVPEDLAEAYDVPLGFIRDGGTLPWSGDFLTGAGHSANETAAP
jgi:hypothetical protein